MWARHLTSFLLAACILLSAPALFAQTIPNLTAAGTTANGDLLVVSQSGSTFKITLLEILDQGAFSISFIDPGTQTLGVAATVILATRDLMTVTGDAGANTIATITTCNGGQARPLTLLFVDALVTITDDNGHGADTVDLSAAFVSADDTVLELICNGVSWYQSAPRSTN